jgi:biotin synthase
MLHPAVKEASRVIDDGKPIGRALADRISLLEGEDVLDIASLANKVRNRHAGGTETCSILNARSGACGENCRFCAQSAHHETCVEEYGLLQAGEIAARARSVYEDGVRHFGIVTSGYGYPEVTAEFREVCAAITLIHRDLPKMHVCASLGVLGEEPVRRLAECMIRHYNINLQVAPSRYAELIADTHPVEDRIATVEALRRHGVSVCCGAIFGVGESPADRIDLAYLLNELDVAVIPLNVLIPIAGTPLEGREPISVLEAVKSFSLFRLINPSKVIKFAAGRETLMNDFQGLLMLSGINGILTGGYLTTRGRSVEADRKMLDEVEKFHRRTETNHGEA